MLDKEARIKWWDEYAKEKMSQSYNQEERLTWYFAKMAFIESDVSEEMAERKAIELLDCSNLLAQEEMRKMNERSVQKHLCMQVLQNKNLIV